MSETVEEQAKDRPESRERVQDAYVEIWRPARYRQ
jgi:hypothetical protein